MIHTRFPNIIGTKEWLSSPEYDFVIRNKNNEKEIFTNIGAWRWDTINKYKKLIMDYVFNDNLKGIDFGGYLGPIGGNTEIVDIELKTSLYDYDAESIDYIFTSHTLEHLNKIPLTLFRMYYILKPKGILLIHVPSYKKEVWRKGRDPEHFHTFKLEGDDFEDAEALDTLIKEAGFNIYIAEHTYKCCIFIYAEKKDM